MTSELMYNSRVCRRLALLLSILLSTCLARGQNAGKTKVSYKLLSIHVKGLNHYRQEEVVSATGLQLGRDAQEQDFKQAVQMLGESGMFNEVAYSYEYSTSGCKLEIQVSENDKLVPILFDNFVWFSDEELLKLLHSRIPLFEGRLPLGGGMADEVSTALNAILAEKKISGESDYLRAGKMNGPIDSYIYRLNLHPVLVRNTEFPGAASAELPSLQTNAKPLAGQDYLRTKMRPQEKLNFLPVYLARGYLKAEFAEAEAKIAQDGPPTLVDVSFPVTPGIQYKLTNIEWAGNSVFRAQELQELVHLKTGEPANAVELDADLDAIHKLYGTKGYLEANVKAMPELNESNATVNYQLAVNEGAIYHMGELLIDGLNEDATKKMQLQWQMKKGDPYDDSYLSRFFKTMYHDIGLSRSFKVIPKATVNSEDKTVAVALHFVPK